MCNIAIFLNIHLMSVNPFRLQPERQFLNWHRSHRRFRRSTTLGIGRRRRRHHHGVATRSSTPHTHTHTESARELARGRARTFKGGALQHYIFNVTVSVSIHGSSIPTPTRIPPPSHCCFPQVTHNLGVKERRNEKIFLHYSKKSNCSCDSGTTNSVRAV